MNKVQLRHHTELTPEQYVKQQAWGDAKLFSCPVHSKGGCNFRRHGTYERKSTPGLHIRRYCCRKAHKTFSFLPDFCAARVGELLHSIETEVAVAEQSKAKGFKAHQVAERARPTIGLQGALRWLRRRKVWVLSAFSMLMGVHPGALEGATNIAAARRVLRVPHVLIFIRRACSLHLQTGAAPTAFGTLATGAQRAQIPQQHGAGPDPPE